MRLDKDAPSAIVGPLCSASDPPLGQALRPVPLQSGSLNTVHVRARPVSEPATNSCAAYSLL